MTYLLRTGVLSGFPQLLDELGGDYQKMLRELEINADLLAEEDNLASLEVLLEMLEIAAATTRCPHFSLLLASKQPLSFLGIIALAMKAAPDLRAAIMESLNHHSLHAQGVQWSLRAEQELAYYNLSLPVVDPVLCKQGIDLGIGQAFNAIRLLCPGWSPVRVCFHYEAPIEDWFYRQFFGAPVMFNCEFDGIAFRASDLDFKISSDQDYLSSILSKYMTTLEHQSGTDQTLVAQVKRVIRQAIQFGHDCSIESISAFFACDKRTLQRRLKAEHNGFQSLRQEVRFSLAQQYLRDSNLPLSNIAEVLGFSDISTFSRAFKQQFGSSPKQWRKDNRPGTPAT